MAKKKVAKRWSEDDARRGRANDLHTLLALAVDGAGISMTPHALALPYLLSGALVEVLPDTVAVSWSVWAVTIERRLLPRRAQVFIEHIRRFLPGALTGKPEE